ncbi:MAG: T9SS type A sorting domain-containing protein [Bacteroidota bacterium]
MFNTKLRATLALSLLVGIFAYLIAAAPPARDLTKPSYLETPQVLARDIFPTSGALGSALVPVDRFGNELTFAEIKLPVSLPSAIAGGCNCLNGSGIFQLTFADVCEDRDYGFDDPDVGLDRQAVVCQVFADLSVLLNPTGAIAPNSIRVLVRESEGNGVDELPNAALAAASPIILPGFPDGIARDMLMSTIQANSNAYEGLDLFDPTIDVNSAHGLLRFNFDNFDFFLNNQDPTEITPPDQNDLYSVTLHESLHLLGIYSIIDATANNQSRLANFGSPGTYGKFDTHIRTINGANLTSNGTPFYLRYPTNVPYAIDVATNSFIQSPVCSADAEYSGDELPNQTLYLPNPWNDSGLSHLNCDATNNFPGDEGCALDNGYIMNSCGPAGTTQRHPAQEEVSILCDLGYQTGTTFGTVPSNEEGENVPFETYRGCANQSCVAIGVNDILEAPFTAITGGPVLEVPAAAFLGNDINATGYIPNSFEILNTNIELGTITDLGNGEGFSLLPSGLALGWMVVRYLPFCEEGRDVIPGDWAYILILITSEGLDDLPCPSTVDCNLICDGNFEEELSTAHYDYRLDGLFEPGSPPSPDYYPGAIFGPMTCAGVDFQFPDNAEILPQEGDSYIGILGNTNGRPEGWEFRLREPVTPDQTYQLSFWVNTTCDATVNFGFSETITCPADQNINMFDAIYNGELVACDGYDYQLFNEVSIDVLPTINDEGDNIAWEQYTVDFSPTVVGNYLLLSLENIEGDFNFLYVYFDNIRLVEIPNPPIAITHTVEDLPCPGEAINIPVTVCTDENPEEGVTLDAFFQSVNLSFGNGGDFVNGTAVLDNFTPNNEGQFCATATLELLVGESVEPGTTFEVFIDPDGACLNTGDDYLITFEVPQQQAANADFTIDFDMTSCEVLLTPQVLEGGTHEWWQDGTSISTEASPTVIVTPGVYVFEHVFTPFELCQGTSAQQTLDVSPLEFAVTQQVVNEDPICPGDEVFVAVEYCFREDPTQLTMTPALPGIGISLGNSGDFSTGSFTLDNFVLNNNDEFCQSAVLHLVLDGTGTAGQAFFVPMNVSDNCRAIPIQHNVGVFVSPEEQLDATFSAVIDDFNCAVSLTSAATQGLHEWLLDGVLVSTEVNPTLDLDPAVYTIVHIITGNCTTVQTEQVVDLSECGPPPPALTCPCEGENALNINAFDGTDIEDIEELAMLIDDDRRLNVNNRCLAINGRLEIGNAVDGLDLAFFYGEIRMQPGAEIVIQPGADVQFRGNGGQAVPAHIYGCETLWRGITVSETATLTIANTLVENAQAALQIQANGTVFTGRNRFENNFLGVYADAGLTGGNIAFTSNSDEFIGSSALLPAFDPNVGPYTTGTTSAAAVYVLSGSQSSVITLGSNLPTPALIRDLPAGIIASTNVNLSVQNTRFEHIRGVDGFNYLFEGNAITHAGGSGALLVVEAAGATGIPVFDDCVWAVQTRNTSTFISDAEVVNCDNGFRVRNANFRDIEIVDNDLAFFGTGIWLAQNDLATDITVNHNNLRKIPAPVDGQVRGGDAIYVIENTMRTESGHARIQGNTITIEGGEAGVGRPYASGIYVEAGSYWYLDSNIPIRLRQSSNDVGIALSGSIHNVVNNNSVENLPDGILQGKRTGLYVENTRNTVYSCNDFISMHTGAHFVAGQSEDTDFQNNYFGGNQQRGLLYEDLLTINAQEWRGNRWAGSFAEADAVNELMTDNPFSFGPQAYLIHSPLDNYFPSNVSLPNYQGNGQPWMIFNTSGAPPICNLDGIIGPGDGSTIDLDQRILRGEAWTGAFSTERTWDSQQYTFAKGKALENEGQLTNYWAAYLNRHDKEALGSFYAQAQRLRSQFTLPTGTHTTLRQQLEAMRVALRSTQASALAYSLSLTTRDQAAWRNQSQQLAMAQQRWQNSYAASWTNAQAGIGDLLLSNDALVSALQPQANEKSINRFYLQTIANGSGSLSTEQQNELRVIANQCPLQGGNVVHRARSLYRQYDEAFIVTDDCLARQALQADNTEPAAMQYKQKNELGEYDPESTFSVAPNPVLDLLQITFASDSPGTLSIFDHLGRHIYQQSLNRDTHVLQLDMSLYQSGLYYLKWQTATTEETQKIILVH